jgi:hypothetical protein
MRLRDWLKISQHKHSGRLRPHEHTSYLPLALLVIAVGLTMVLCSVPDYSSASPGPAGGSVGLSGTVPKAPPKVGATISTPTNGQRFSTSPITVSGTCPANTLIEVYKNDIFAGSALCDNDGTYKFQVDLLIGKNDLVARVYDVLNQAGPDSNTVTVFYDALPAQSAPLSLLNFNDRQLLLNTDSIYRGVFPDQLLNIPIDVIGGSPPYAINVQWGDSNNKVIARPDNQSFNAGHTYHKPGTYQITLQASDSQGRVAFLTVAAIVNGKPAVAAASTGSNGGANKLLVLWPLFAVTATMVVSFWFGEQREKKILKPLVHPL